VGAATDPAAHAPEKEIGCLIVAPGNDLEVLEVRLDQCKRMAEVAAAFLHADDVRHLAELHHSFQCHGHTHSCREVVHDDGKRCGGGHGLVVGNDLVLLGQAVGSWRKHEAFVTEILSLFGAGDRISRRQRIDAGDQGDAALGHTCGSFEHLRPLFGRERVVLTRGTADHDPGHTLCNKGLDQFFKRRQVEAVICVEGGHDRNQYTVDIHFQVFLRYWLNT